MNNKTNHSRVTSLDELRVSLSVKTEKAFQLLSPENIDVCIFERTPITTPSGIYDEIGLNDAEDQYVVHGYDSGNYSSQAIPNKETGGRSVKAQKAPSSNRGGNRYITAKTVMSASNDADFVLRLT